MIKKNNSIYSVFLDITDLHVSAIRRHCESTKIYPDNNDRMIQRSTIQTNLSEHDVNSNQRKTQSIIYSIYLPDDFTLDETVGLTEHSTGPLSNEIFKYVNTISYKLSQNKLNLRVQLSEDELKFIR
jgi:hypothetical protein